MSNSLDYFYRYNFREEGGRVNISNKKFLNLLALGALFVICLISFHQLLFSGEIINATDILTQQYFWNYFIRENLFADPCFQTWLPYINAGTP
ncbi:MAG: hypothetical protein RBT80_23100, partial [Candidatus Vecturithrix sp.]|nr:hypothetical protein [Candidatus Vecturithrix sp.]